MSTHRFRPFIAALAVALGMATAVSAQDRPSEFDSYVMPGWTFTPGVSLSGMWDSNVALAGQQAEGRKTAGDNLMMLVPFAQVDLTANRTSFTAGYRGYIRRYTDVEELNGYDQRAYTSVRHAVTRRLTLFAHNEFSEMPTTDMIELNGLPFVRIGTTTNRLNAGLEARLTKFTDLLVRYDNTWASFDRQDQNLSGGTIHGVIADVRRRLSERLAIGAEGRIRRSDVTRTGPRVIWFQDASATVDYKVTEFVSAGVAAGFSHLKDSSFDEGRTSPYFRAELERRVERGTAGIAFERSFTPAYGLSGSNDNRELRGYVRVPFSRNRFYVDSHGLWRRSVPFFADELLLDSFMTQVSLGYAATRWLRMEAYHGFSRQDSIITGGEVDRHRVGAHLVVSQPMRIR